MRPVIATSPGPGPWPPMPTWKGPTALGLWWLRTTGAMPPWKLSLRLSPRILRHRSGSAMMRRSVRSNSSRKASPKPCCRSSYHRTAASSSSSASGWLTTRMELVADVLHNLLHRTAIHLAFFDFARAPLNDFVPLRFSVRVHRIIETGNELAGKERPVLFGQGQHLGHFLSSNAHAAKISTSRGVLARV